MDSERRESLLDCETNEKNGLMGRLWMEEKIIWRVAFPSILSRVTSFGVLVVTQSFLGHVGEVDLAAFALSQSIFLRFVNGILVGNSLNLPHSLHNDITYIYYNLSSMN